MSRSTVEALPDAAGAVAGSGVVVGTAWAEPPGPSPVVSPPCPVCGGPALRFRTAAMVARDIAETETSWEVWRETRGAPPLQLQHDEPAPVEGCDGCGTLWRSGPGARSAVVARYRDDTYSCADLQELHRRELLDARGDRGWLRSNGVVPGARLVEVASYVGAFLCFAREQGAEAIGVDPGEQVVGFTRGLGLDVRHGTLDTVDLAGPFDGVWILNGFEQMPRPADVVARARDLLRPGGRLVLRTPNADFARLAYEPHASSFVRVTARLHQVWGVPFLHCFSPDAITRLLTDAGFAAPRFRARPPHDRPSARQPVDPAAVAPLSPWMDVTAVRR